MTDIDLSKYDGADQYLSCECGAPPLSRHDCEHRRAYVAAQTDGPALLAEVKRLREELDSERLAHNVCLKIHRGCDSCLQAEEKLTALRQSHARLLAALLLVGRVEKRAGVPYYNLSTPYLIHIDQMRELGAAVAEAEAL